MTERSYADLADSATDFDPEVQFDRNADCLEQKLIDVRASLLKELDDIFDNAQQISCTRLSLAIEVMIDVKIEAAKKVSK